MLSNIYFIVSIIDQIQEKLDTITNKYLGDPIIGFVVFVGLLIIGFWAASSFSSK